MIYGVDVSRHQGDVNFADMSANSEMKFAIVKATEGKDYEDPQFRDNWSKLMALDPETKDGNTIIRGVYHFARMDLRPDQGRSAGELEARWLVQVLREVGGYGEGALPPALDWEKYGGTPATNVEWIRGFVDVVESELGRRPMIYTGPNVWYYTTNDSDAFVDYGLWEVKYNANGSDPQSNPPLMPRKDSRRRWCWKLWQWSGGGDFNYYQPQYGDIPGVPSGTADVNRFNGTMEELREMAILDGNPTPPTPPTPDLGEAIMPLVDLSTMGTSSYVQLSAIVQGLLMGNGYGPDGLTDKSTGLPDGKAGSKTLQALRDFKVEHGLSQDTIMDPQTWWLMMRP